MFSDPAQTGLLSPCLFHHRPGVHIGPCDSTRRPFMQFRFKERQPIAEDAVIVSPPGVAGDAAVSLDFGGAIPTVVVHSDGDDRPATRQDDAGVCAPRGVAGHPPHGAVKPSAQPGL